MSLPVVYKPKDGACGFEDCHAPASFDIEWYGVNQYGKNPLLVDSRSVCASYRHQLELLYHEDFGGYPDELVEHASQRRRPRLLEQLIDARERLTRRTAKRAVWQAPRTGR